MRLLDLFCGAGGAAMGYHRAGFEVVGVDIVAQPRYPFAFHRGDALTWPLDGFDAIHASPVCRRWSAATRARGDASAHPDQLALVRPRLVASGRPYVIENVPGAPLVAPRLLCGSMFDLDVMRHRCFETNWGLADHPWPCRHRIWDHRFHPHRSDRKATGNRARVVSVAGHGNDGPGGRVADWRRAMDIDWMSRDELAQAVPPAYTHHIGTQLWAHLEAADRLIGPTHPPD